jgi:hypothetical protein
MESYVPIHHPASDARKPWCHGSSGLSQRFWTGQWRHSWWDSYGYVKSDDGRRWSELCRPTND